MTISDTKAIKDFKKAVTAAKNRRTMFWRSQAPDLAGMLDQALGQLKQSVHDPQAGVDALIDFYKRDAAIFERCDDSFGSVGDVFRMSAADLFVVYAKRCPDKDKVSQQILDVQEGDDYGVRDTLIDNASKYLHESDIRKLIDKIEQKVPIQEDIFRQRKWFYMIESLARQIKDGALFEQTRQRNWQDLNGTAYIEIAQVFFSSGDAPSAYDRLKKAAECGIKDDYEYTELLRQVCRALGKVDEATKVSWDIFRRTRCKETLNELLTQIGQDKRAEVVYKEVDFIMSAKEFSITDAQFLIEVGEDRCAEEYVVARREQLDGGQYYHLPALAKHFETKGSCLAPIVIYRALLEANLAKALSKYYSHGVRYLRKLDVLAGRVRDWKMIESHDLYIQKIRQQHSRKPAFWARYETKSRYSRKNDCV
jgi:tetratricopeptide (TPR) repeat protein